MNETAAKNLVKTTFENLYSRERFLIFTKNIFRSFDESKAFHARGYVKDKFKKTTPVIKTYERFGTFTDTNNNKVDILAVYLEKDSSLDKARTAQRNFAADYLKQRDSKDAAFVAFVPPTLKNWRLSLVKMDYSLGKSKAGKIKAITELTPARRFSFSVGEDENTHTAQRQILPVLQKDDTPPALSDLEQAFSVEVVTKDFFEKYKTLFLKTKEELDRTIAKDAKIKSDFTEKNIDPVDFAKKLLGQIVFLYFLQKKGWFGVERDEDWGTGPKDFLRRLFEKKLAGYDNFFNDILEPLFYEALAIERSDDFYSKFNCKIPFLNGGLFDPLGNYDWIHTDIRLADSLFSNENKTNEGDIGDGILDVFDRYNFTVKEDEPLEREVAVDPEMLGKVFENLLEVKDRKSKGTYYTPREIVHYMCQESLINYLLTELNSSSDGGRMDTSEVESVSRDDIETLIRLGETAIENEARVINEGRETKDYHFRLPQSIRDNAHLLDEKLEKIHVCDPAVGSGAFLVGMMTEIIRTRNALNPYLSLRGAEATKQSCNPYDFKRHAIQNCLYGVDIDPGAVEIAKLRLWLSLIVDEQDLPAPRQFFVYVIRCNNNSLYIGQTDDLVKRWEQHRNGQASWTSRYKPIEVVHYEIYETRDGAVNREKQLKSGFGRKWLKRELGKNRLRKWDYLAARQAGIKQIKPLPNLDYKIMQGNSLLEEYEGVKLDVDGHDQPQQMKFDQAKTGSEILKEKLVDLRKEFFRTAHKSEKDKLKEQIEDLTWQLIETSLKEQKKLSLLPEIERLKKTNIKPFFLWKLNFSEVFEISSEKGGFDVVIANPPYIDSESMVKEDPKTREAILETYKFTRGNWDIYIAFFELGFKVLNDDGALTFITPDKWISKPFGGELRRQTFDNIYSIVKAGRKVFEYAKVDSIISFFSKINSPSIRILEFQSGSFILKREVDKKLIKEPFAFDYLFSNYLNLLLKIERASGKLSNLGICENACATSDAYKLAKLIKNLADGFEKDRYLKVINTGTIGKYFSKWGKQEMTYLGYKYRFPIVEKSEFTKFFKNTYASKAMQRKVIMKGLNLLDACLDLEGNVIPGKSTLIITSKDINNLRVILLIVNSKLPFFYIKERYPASSYNQGISFTKEMINSFPFPDLDTQVTNLLCTTADKILAVTESDDYMENSNEQIQVKEYQNQIDQLVYKLYGLSPEEIKIVEQK